MLVKNEGLDKSQIVGPKSEPEWKMSHFLKTSKPYNLYF